jgi:bifunctional non-homologous end joining protein LigD
MISLQKKKLHTPVDRVPWIVEVLRSLRLKSATIDGEGVICDDRGVTDFERLRTALAHHEAPEVFLFAFDLLELDGWDIRRELWETRRKTMASLLRRAGEGIRLSEHLEGGQGQAIFRHACSLGLEGIVSKRRDAPYRSGRCADWIKVKNPDAPAAMRIFE